MPSIIKTIKIRPPEYGVKYQREHKTQREIPNPLIGRKDIGLKSYGRQVQQKEQVSADTRIAKLKGELHDAQREYEALQKNTWYISPQEAARLPESRAQKQKQEDAAKQAKEKMKAIENMIQEECQKKIADELSIKVYEAEQQNGGTDEALKAVRSEIKQLNESFAGIDISHKPGLKSGIEGFDKYSQVDSYLRELKELELVLSNKVFQQTKAQKMNGLSQDVLGLLDDCNVVTDTRRIGTDLQANDKYARKQHAKNQLLKLGYSEDQIKELSYYRKMDTDAEQMEKTLQSAQAYAGKNAGTAILATAGSVLSKAGSFAAPFAALADRFTAPKGAPININSGYFMPGRVADTIRETVRGTTDWNEDLFGHEVDLFDVGYDLLTSTADSMLAACTGGAAGSIMLGTQACASSMVDITQRGGSANQAIMGGLASGIFEGLFEKVSIGNFEKLKEIPITGFRDLSVNLGKSVMVNGSDELFTEMANIAYDTIANGSISNVSRSIRAYMAEGYTEKEAKRMAAADLGRQVAGSGIMGMLQGGMMGGAGSAIGWHKGKKAAQTGRQAAALLAAKEAEIIGAAQGKQKTEMGTEQNTSAAEMQQTNIDTRSKGHTEEQQRIIQEYQGATDLDLVEFYEKARTGELPQKAVYPLKSISDRAAADILNTVGVDTRGFKTVIEGRIAEHIYINHGKSGKTNRSMKDSSDVGRIQYVLDNYDEIYDGGRSKAYTTVKPNGKPGTAKTVVYAKAVDNTYYVVEAVPETSKKTVYVVSAFLDTPEHFKAMRGESGTKKEGKQLIDTSRGPNVNVQNDFAYPSNNSISNDLQISKGDIAAEGDSSAPSAAEASPAVSESERKNNTMLFRRAVSESKALGENGKKAAMFLYDGAADPAAFFSDFARAYYAGANGGNPVSSSVMADAELRGAMSAGNLDTMRQGGDPMGMNPQPGTANPTLTPSQAGGIVEADGSLLHNGQASPEILKTPGEIISPVAQNGGFSGGGAAVEGMNPADVVAAGNVSSVDDFHNANEGAGDSLNNAGIPKTKFDEILKTPKYYRPDPATYLEKKYIANHKTQFKDGVTKISYQAPTGYAGPPGGTFVMPTSVADDLIARAGGNISELERLLGLDPGELGTDPVRIDIANPSGLRMPSGNEKGANPKWLPGGYTSGGIPEIIIDSPGPGQYTIRTIK